MFVAPRKWDANQEKRKHWGRTFWKSYLFFFWCYHQPILCNRCLCDLGFSVKPVWDFRLCFFGNVGKWGFLGFIFWFPTEEDSHTEREMVQGGLWPERIQISHMAGSCPKLQAAKFMALSPVSSKVGHWAARKVQSPENSKKTLDSADEYLGYFLFLI